MLKELFLNRSTKRIFRGETAIEMVFAFPLMLSVITMLIFFVRIWEDEKYLLWKFQ